MIGAGLSGLAATHHLLKAGADVRLLESTPRCGGYAGTTEVDGFRFERGPNTIQASSRNFRELCGEIGIADKLRPASPDVKKRYIYHRERLVALPTNPLALATTKLFSVREKLYLASEPLRKFSAPGPGAPEPSAFDLFADRIGCEPARLLAAAFVRGIYAGDARKLGARSAFPRLWKLLTEHGGLVRGMLRSRPPKNAAKAPGPDVPRTSLLSFEGGLEELVQALELRAEKALNLGDPVVQLERHGDAFHATCASGQTFQAQRVLLCTSAVDASALLSNLGLDPKSQQTLQGIECASVGQVQLGFEKDALQSLPSGFGFLVPPAFEGPETLRILGCIFVSCAFPWRAPAGGTALSCIYPLDALAGLDDNAAGELACSELARALGLAQAPIPAALQVIHREHAIPQYTLGHADRMQELEEDLARVAPGMIVGGNWVHGVGVEQVVQRAKAAAQTALGFAQ